ncbi:GATA transcription factor 11-like [Gastrolobium bilobum]|uniref:GATA transcription factor 11-like n=1 Tax=Gastrolobium bilobum TaxID=150636 RepID=UPI002AB25ABB|nr:GATA transcription factor 11-like [Gastrolobium bilobum]
MKDGWFFDKNFNGLSDENFDEVIKLLDFTLEDVETDDAEEDWDAQFKQLEEPSLGAFPVSSSGLCDKTQKNENPKLERSFSAPLAKTTGPTYGKTIPIQNVSRGKDLRKLLTNSPVSVFENSSSSSVENSNFELPVIPVKRPRGRRQRLSSFSLLFSIPFFPASPAVKKDQRGAVYESDLETHHARKLLSRVTKKQREKDLSMLSYNIEMKRSSSQEPFTPKKCMHCEVTKTPQWREGPMGPKTLCNACGVRYRTGRLFPEYRPAASPTFVASLHSNSHKKVIEMRKRATQETNTLNSLG